MQKVEDLIKELESNSISDYISIVNNSSIPTNEFDKYISWNEDGYTRNCITRNSKFELLLICWKPGQGSSIHGHDGQKCLVHIVQGELEEKLYDKEDNTVALVRERVLSKGKTTYMDDKMGFHSIRNNSTTDLITLHLYMNPIDQCEVFNSSTNQFEIKELSYNVDFSLPSK